MNPTLRRIVMAVLGVAIGALCLWLSARNVDWAEAARIFRAADLGGILTGVALYGAAMIMRAIRWRAILAFRAPVGAGMSLQALLAGYAVNAALPARLGELFRADYLARRTGLSRSGVLASIVVERLLDLLAVVGLLAVGLALHGGSDPASRHALIGGAAVASIGIGVLLLIATRLSQANAEAALALLIARLPGGRALANRLGAMLGDFAQLLRIVRTPRFALVALGTLPIWAVEVCSIWSICGAVGVDLSPAGMLSLMGGASLSTLLPTAPGYVGSYQIAYVLILGQFDVDATSAIVAASTVQIYLIGGYTLVGLATWAGSSVLAATRGNMTKARP
ncbi:MAG: flippase-like domain-containing protein [Alphaproteobacteria bacterium]|nr:flippase-like domain-containing protein [Alphaproteobacteria bacterium]MCW5741546.1 flippase-like domain-containing protein [Alphaproteobacteria bacterium]